MEKTSIKKRKKIISDQEKNRNKFKSVPSSFYQPKEKKIQCIEWKELLRKYCIFKKKHKNMIKLEKKLFISLKKPKNSILFIYYYRGIPLKQLCDIFLNLFGRMFENNEEYYNVILNEVFGMCIEELPGKTPTFCEKENLEEILINNHLTENGLKVNFIIIFIEFFII